MTTPIKIGSVCKYNGPDWGMTGWTVKVTALMRVHPVQPSESATDEVETYTTQREVDAVGGFLKSDCAGVAAYDPCRGRYLAGGHEVDVIDLELI